VIEGLVAFDGHEVPAWIVAILSAARHDGIWHGSVISGYRTPAYSESLCYAMCGAPSCPGRCAGRATNHSCPPTYRGVKYEGAVDVTDAPGLRSYCRLHNAPLRGDGEVLPYDTPHFSHEGN